MELRHIYARWLWGWWFSPVMLLAGVAAFCFSGCGCPRDRDGAADEPELVSVYTNRIHDPVYIEALSSNRIQQGLSTSARHDIADKMRKLKAEVQATLAADADEQALAAALAEHPEWRELEAEHQARADEVLQTLEDAKALVRARMLQEKSDLEAVAAGRAKPVATDDGVNNRN